MNHEPQGAERFSRFDQSISRMRIANHEHAPCAICALIYCLKNFDIEAAEIIRRAQRATSFPLEHPQLKALWEVQSERDAREIL